MYKRNYKRISLRGKTYPVHSSPVPHIVVPSKKELHGWWQGKRECTSERLLINPYNGCSIGCFYCYSLSYPGYFQIYRNKGIIIVAKDFDKEVALQLDSINVATCGYLSPITDPFQLINNRYHLSEKIIKKFVDRNIPIEFITKAKVPEGVLDMIKLQKHSFIQISILTFKENLRKILAPGGATVKGLFCNIKKARERNIFTVARIDPIFPHITDNFLDLTELVKKFKHYGVQHVIVSVLDIPLNMKESIFKKINLHFGSRILKYYDRLYTENIDGWLNADINYRRRIFDILRNLCDKENLSFSLCMEYEIVDNKIRGLNREFSNSVNCEGINIPVYVRKQKNKFYPACDCNGDCLNCVEAECGITELAMGVDGAKKDWKLKDYKKWSKEDKTYGMNELSSPR